ncbi:hypothetical protein A3F06_00725 [candidate division TM6 bacterium RIFCSPHIGHO2_12_FULL_36_22]|nr:MAG: hypothetical protein A3F06_00725 [candidate division TM6 bacterium RIFCSPHIGHO2_12_FULL_36_22]
MKIVFNFLFILSLFLVSHEGFGTPEGGKRQFETPPPPSVSSEERKRLIEKVERVGKIFGERQEELVCLILSKMSLGVLDPEMEMYVGENGQIVVVNQRAQIQRRVSMNDFNKSSALQSPKLGGPSSAPPVLQLYCHANKNQSNETKRRRSNTEPAMRPDFKVD